MRRTSSILAMHHHHGLLHAFMVSQARWAASDVRASRRWGSRSPATGATVWRGGVGDTRGSPTPPGPQRTIDGRVDVHTAAGGGRDEALAHLRAVMASADGYRRRDSTASLDGDDVRTWRYQREQLHAALANVTAVPRPLAPDIAGAVHQALRLLDELRWIDEDPHLAQ